ncbi:LytR/AlgR family response regulator transcription factor [Flavobacterium sp. GT3P67]|uniref:LytR/AlgR family response regulator transcription factor n=1 Tax=Flavobacterium sp. GT3P67 TaxID=2541722 RepID=UPI0010529994|nr:LytTR family DNA-binding domain-containing protein [Flavobacterium sp. GT3P67]TDE48582.1 response regulator transcription factor [Flavobacterium sp. GT3P67]
MKCIAIDDEPLALELISGYIQKTPFLEFVAGFTNPFNAMNFLLKNPIDLVFIDINMPELSGIELLKALPVLPKIIFTTAYSEYGAESYEFNAVDYLLKPVKYDRFLKGVNKAYDLSSLKKEEISVSVNSEPHSQFVLIKSGSKTFKIATDDIFYIEAAGNYMLFYTLKGKIMTLLPMSEILKMLPSNTFVRIHKSYIISLKHIEVIEKSIVVINKTRVPIGITYKEHFSNIIKND